MIAWLDHLRRLTGDDERCVLVTMAGARGSTPREIGAKMIVTATESFGTIGGGQLEYQCMQAACEWLRPAAGAKSRSRLMRFPLGANCGQCCGGVAEILFEEITPARSAWVAKLADLHAAGTAAVMVTARQSRGVAGKVIVTADDCFASDGAQEPSDAMLSTARRSLQPAAVARHAMLELAGNAGLPVLIEPVCAPDFHIVLFGAGHVGSACAAVLSTLEATIDLVDSRRGFPGGRYAANVRSVQCADPSRVAQSAPAGCYYLVMTHDHALDFQICARILQRREFAYCGLIGSRSKRRRFEKRFRALGLSESDIAALTCPIGSDEISGKKPAQIAIAVAAQLLHLQERGVHAGVERKPLSLTASRPAQATGGRHDR